MELNQLFERMKLEHLGNQIDQVCEQAAKGELDYKSFLMEVLKTEWRGRHLKGVEARLKQAGLPGVKTLEQFDFGFQPSLDRRVIRELAGLAFVERGENVILLGPPGVGKTHLAIAVAVKSVEAGHRVLFLTLEELLSRLKRAQTEHRLERMLAQLAYPKLLVLDEIGYLPMTREEASLFLPSGVPALRKSEPHPHLEQELPRLGRGAGRCGDRHRHPRSAAAPLDHAQHQGRVLPPQGKAQGRAADPAHPTRRRNRRGHTYPTRTDRTDQPVKSGHSSSAKRGQSWLALTLAGLATLAT
jgi:DNA replication protein DnaC